MGWHYENLENEELQRIAIARFGNVLRPLKEIGREAVIKKLKQYDKFLVMEKGGKNVFNRS
jgi:hypothetical protein